MKYLNQTTVNVIAIATAVVAGLSLVGGGRGPDKAMKEQMLMNRRLDYDIARPVSYTHLTLPTICSV